MKMIGLARLGRDAELRSTAGGEYVANLSLAFSYGRKQDGKQPTQWVDGSLWGKRAEALAQYLTKGSAVVVTLSDVHVEMYEKNGEQRAALRARVDDLEFAGGGDGQRQQSQQAQAPKQQADAGDSGADFDDDSIPF